MQAFCVINLAWSEECKKKPLYYAGCTKIKIPNYTHMHMKLYSKKIPLFTDTVNWNLISGI
jgi:hypothetical protein